jgi:hypothetical protein
MHLFTEALSIRPRSGSNPGLSCPANDHFGQQCSRGFNWGQPFTYDLSDGQEIRVFRKAPVLRVLFNGGLERQRGWDLPLGIRPDPASLLACLC